ITREARGVLLLALDGLLDANVGALLGGRRPASADIDAGTPLLALVDRTFLVLEVLVSFDGLLGDGRLVLLARDDHVDDAVRIPADLVVDGPKVRLAFVPANDVDV